MDGDLVVAKVRQEEVDAKWRPWFESLTPWQNEVLVRTQAYKFPGHCNPDYTRVVSFPENQSEHNWLFFKSVVESPRDNVMVMLKRIPKLEQHRTPCPAVECMYDFDDPVVYTVIMHLNDDHRYTFIQIADWLDTLGVDFSFPID